MFLAPKEIKEEIPNKSLVYTPKRVLVSKEFTFDAAHHLFHYEGKCKSLHGHTYRLQIAISGMLDERGMVFDFADLKTIYKEHLEPHLDHRYLNESLPYMNTTAENMVYWIYKTFEANLSQIRGLRMESVRLYETPSSYAEFRREWDLEWEKNVSSSSPFWKYSDQHFKEKAVPLVKRPCLSEQAAAIIIVTGATLPLLGMALRKPTLWPATKSSPN